MANLSSNLQSVLENRLRYLPEITGQAIHSIDWATRIVNIGHKYGLHVDEMEEFQGVVLKSMIGLITPENFEMELINALALSPATTEKIITELNTDIFEPIHDYVMNGGKVDELKKSGLELETPLPETAPVLVPTGSSILEIPASPEPKAEHAEKWEDYF
jgi:hypothetical protein